jgi:hypothetical protein
LLVVRVGEVVIVGKVNVVVSDRKVVITEY